MAPVPAVSPVPAAPLVPPPLPLVPPLPPPRPVPPTCASHAGPVSLIVADRQLAPTNNATAMTSRRMQANCKDAIDNLSRRTAKPLELATLQRGPLARLRLAEYWTARTEPDAGGRRSAGRTRTFRTLLGGVVVWGRDWATGKNVLGYTTNSTPAGSSVTRPSASHSSRGEVHLLSRRGDSIIPLDRRLTWSLEKPEPQPRAEDAHREIQSLVRRTHLPS